MNYIVDDPDNNARQIVASLPEALQIARIAVTAYADTASVQGEWPDGVQFVKVYEIDHIPLDLDECEIENLKPVAQTVELEGDDAPNGEPTCYYEVRRI